MGTKAFECKRDPLPILSLLSQGDLENTTAGWREALDGRGASRGELWRQILTRKEDKLTRCSRR